MNRKWNRKFIAWLLGILLVTRARVHALQELQVQRHARSWLEQAHQAKEHGAPRQCLNLLSRYLTYQPTDLDALAEYSLLLEQTATSPRDRRQAVAILEQVLTQQPQRRDVRERLVPITMQQGGFSEARDHLKILLAESPAEAPLEELLGQCLEATGDYEQATAWYEKSIEHGPDRLSAYLRLANLWQQRREDPRQARRVIDRMVTANERSVPALLARVRYCKEAGELPQAAADLEHALQIGPIEPAVLLVAAELAPALGRIDETRAHLRAGLKVHPTNVALYRALAELELTADRPLDALACVRRGLALIPEQPDLLQFLCELRIQRGELDEAGRIVARLRGIGWLPVRAGYWDARIVMQQGRWLEAARMLESAREPLAAAPEWTTPLQIALGRCYEQLGNRDQQLAAYRRAVAGDTASVPARLGLGSALLAVGKVSEALAIFRPLVKRPHAPVDCWLALTRALLRRNQQLPAAQRDWLEVQRTLEQAEAVCGASMPLRLLRADVLVEQQQWEAARDLLEKTRDEQPKQLDAWLALANLAEKQGQPKRAMAIIDQARRQLDDPVELRLARLRYAARHGSRLGRALPELERDLDRLPLATRSRLCLELARICYQGRELKAAERLARQVAGQQPHDLRSRFLLLDLLLAGGADEAVKGLLADIRRIEGDAGTHWRLGEAAWLVQRAQRGDRGGLAQARTRLTEVARQRPMWSRVPLLQGAIDELDGKPERAIDQYLRALELGDVPAAMAGRLAQLLFERRRYAEADAALRLLQEQTRVRGPLARLAAEVALANGNRLRAVDLARQAVGASGRDYREQLWLARILEAAGQAQEAEQLLRATAERGGAIPDPWVALVEYLARLGKRDQAEAVLEEMSLQLPPDLLPLALADAYQALAQPERAEEQYRLALAAQPDDFAVLQRFVSFYLASARPQQAVPYLRRLLLPSLSAPEEQVRWARRLLAVTLATGSERQFEEALALLDQNQPGTVEDRRARARVLATRPGYQAEARRLLEDGSDRQPLAPEEEYLLARLYEAAGDARQARAHLLKLAADGRNAQYLAEYIRSLVQAGEVQEARRWLMQLERLEPQAPRTLALEAELRSPPPKATP